ncbi:MULTISPECIES: ATP-binding protein [unclassified Nocardiopsis]|uniref:ATP-binding protein n=1 Tax=unclassified Nocardiopsis TaxID=2649073 RepID=UPI0013571A83|nr:MULTISPECIES: ATP-binding protein [unclassified Nocardiopsis]
MNAELVSSEVDSGASSWSRPSLAEASSALLGGWWDESLGRVAVGDGAHTRDAASRAFPPAAGSVRQAREFAVRLLAAWGVSELAEDVRLIVSELVGNACRHALPENGVHGYAHIVVQMRHLGAGEGVVCMVADSSAKEPVRVDAHHFAESGRGLGLVSAFSREWGWRVIEGRGKIVWAICGGQS